jgi:methanogenic corrinoid protein MtbC1
VLLTVSTKPKIITKVIEIITKVIEIITKVIEIITKVIGFCFLHPDIWLTQLISSQAVLASNGIHSSSTTKQK